MASIALCNSGKILIDNSLPDTDRAYWEKKGTKQTVQLADELLGVAREMDSSLELRYNKFYIGLSNGHFGKATIFVQCSLEVLS